MRKDKFTIASLNSSPANKQKMVNEQYEQDKMNKQKKIEWVYWGHSLFDVRWLNIVAHGTTREHSFALVSLSMTGQTD